MPKRKCVNCSSTNGTKKQEDPYEADVNGDHTLVWLCDPCVELLAREI